VLHWRQSLRVGERQCVGGRKLQAVDQRGVFPYHNDERFVERRRVLGRELAVRAGLPAPEEREYQYENLGNRDLPVWLKKSDIQTMIRDAQVSMIEGPTGSGKSTQLAQYALEMGYAKIVYLEPRIPLADNVSDRFIEELGQQLGVEAAQSLVGVRHSERSNGKGKMIEVMTPDTFLRVFPELTEYQDKPVLIVGDEIHEKDFPTELAVAVAARSLPDHPKWRLCMMSATLDAAPIREVYERKIGRRVPIVSVEGRPFELEVIEEPELTVDEAYAKYREGHTKAQLFTAGKEEIREIGSDIEGRRYPSTRITPFHAKLSRAKIRQATHAKLVEGEKQVIPSTNAGASGITIPGQTLVISDGTVRRQDLDLDGVPGLFREYCAQDELTQQAGRAGRDVGGGLFVLAKPNDSENFKFVPHKDRDPHAPAQIYHTNISRNVLATAALGHDFYSLNDWLIHGVKTRVIIEAYDTLYRLGAIDEYNELTEVGELMNRFPVRPELARAIVAAQQAGADTGTLRQIAATAAAIDCGGLPYFERGIGSAWREDIRQEVEDDYMAQLDMFIATRQFYDGFDVDERALEERNYDLQQTKKAHRTYDKICRALGISISDELVAPSIEQMDELREYLVFGLFDYAHQLTDPPDGWRKTMYASIYDNEAATPRTLSDRGTYSGKDRLVLGFPRRFEKHVKGALEVFRVIEHVMPVTVKQLGRVAMWLARTVPDRTTIRDGRVERIDRKMLGVVTLGEEVSRQKFAHTAETRELLRKAAFDKPTQAVQELVVIKKELEYLVRRVPTDEIERYFPQGIVTAEWLNQRIADAIDTDVDSIFALDNNLRRFMVENAVDRSTWVSQEDVDEILRRSPEVIKVGEQEYQLYYTHGQPIIQGFNLRDAEALPDDFVLDDGRTVMIRYRIERDTKLYTAADIRDYASGL